MTEILIFFAVWIPVWILINFSINVWKKDMQEHIHDLFKKK